jgi:DNA-binding CsgD family transcriptional regulator
MSRLEVGRFTAELVERTQSARDMSTLRDELLVILQALIGCETIYWGHAPGERDEDSHHHRTPDAQGRTALERFASARPRYDLPAIVRAVHADGGVGVDSELLSNAERDRLPLFADVVRPAGIRSFMAGLPQFRSRPLSILVFARHGRGAGFSTHEKEVLRSILGALGLVEAAFRSDLRAKPEGARDERSVVRLLTPRESQVARMIAGGYQNKEIASLLGTSIETVRKQTIRVYEKLGVSGRVQLILRFGRTFEE